MNRFQPFQFAFGDFKLVQGLGVAGFFQRQVGLRTRHFLHVLGIVEHGHYLAAFDGIGEIDPQRLDAAANLGRDEEFGTRLQGAGKTAQLLDHANFHGRDLDRRRGAAALRTLL